MVTRIHAFGPNGELSPGAEAALAGLGGGGGVELVSGVVDLDGTGSPVREFYTTGAATINGVAFPAGTAVVFRRTPVGVWGYIVVDDWTDIAATTTTTTTEATTTTTTTAGTTTTTTTTAGTWTTFAADDFNRADGPLGTTPVGSKTWLAGAPNMHGIESNLAAATAHGVICASYIQTSTLSHQAQVSIMTPAKASGVCVRVSSDGTLEGTSLYRAVYLNGVFYLHVNPTLSSASVLQQWTRAATEGDTITLRAVPNGADVDLTVWHNETLLGTQTETVDVLVGTGVGLFTSGTKPITMDNFEARVP